MFLDLHKTRYWISGILLAMLSTWANIGFAAQLPTLPLATINTTYAPPSGNTITVNSGGSFQSALNSAQLGDTIVLQAGATFTGPFNLPNKTSGSGWIYIRSSAYSSLPVPGTRVGPADAANMPKLVASGDSVITTSSNAHHYRFVGIEFKPTSGSFLYNLISIGNSETSASALPNNITFDRCYIHGDSSVGGRRGVAMDGNSIAVIDSYVSGFKESGADSQALWAHNSQGPFKIVNNYLEAAGENVMFGGADPGIANSIPSDIEIRLNRFFKPLSWMNANLVVKNLLEFKNAKRVLVEGNIFENNWAQSQNGFSILITPRNQNGSASWSAVQDVTIRLNKGINLGSGFNISGEDDTYKSDRTRRVLIENNVMNITGLNGADNRIYQIVHGPTDVTIRHNTTFNTGGAYFMTESSPKADQFVFQDNITTFGDYGFLGTGTNEGLPTLTAYYTNYTFTKNAIIAGGPYSDHYTGLNCFFPSNVSAVNFVNYSGGDYHLASNSPYKNAGTDGKDLGADIDALTAALGGTQPAPDPALPPPDNVQVK